MPRNERDERIRRPEVVYIWLDLVEQLGRDARASARGRKNFNFHQPEESYQRFLNVVQPGSYIQPHRHAHPPKSESFVVLRGEVGFFRFESDGRVAEAVRIGPNAGALGVDVRPGVWHTFLALQPDTVVFEGKDGPYDPQTDKAFAPWAPPERDPGVAAYHQSLIERLPPPTAPAPRASDQ